MQLSLNKTEIERALQECASEPVHIPGTIQPFSALIAYEIASGKVAYVSENFSEVLGRPADLALGRAMSEVVGRRIWHDLQNTAQLRNIKTHRHLVTVDTLGDQERAIAAFQSGDFMVSEIELTTPETSNSLTSLQEHNYLVERIQGCLDKNELLSLTARLMRDATGFDRVMVYAFSPEGHGEILAEARKSSLEPFLNLRFPEWDIPAQAREIMRKVPLRLIMNSDPEIIPILTDTPDRPPLDLTLGESRGVSPIHMQYLRNMKTAATMTLSIVIGGELWGMVSFHHQSPKVCPPNIRQLLLAFLPVLTLKLEHLLDRSALILAQEVDDLQSEIQSGIQTDVELRDLLKTAAPPIFDLMKVHGITVKTESQTYSEGEFPGKRVIDALTEDARESGEQCFFVDSFATRYPEMADDFANCAGALVTFYEDDRVLLLFRKERKHEVTWAGNPEKTIETVDYASKLSPRSSFSHFVQTVSDHCAPWSESDRHLAKRLWPLLSAAERNAFLGHLSRQQNLMIEELNHRVRNILALVKSVSRQARTTSGSIESYSSAIEARIHALAATHDLGTGSARASVSIMTILDTERQPHNLRRKERVSVRGTDHFIRADLAPILALVLHEMMTNAVKYGSLSVPDGNIAIECAKADDGICINWQETGGPPVKKPERRGFGTTLILQAVQHEIGGKSAISFGKTGVNAQLFLPHSALDAEEAKKKGLKAAAPEKIIAPDLFDVPEAYKDGLVLIVDDNFMIASDLRSDIEDAGFRNVEVCSNAEDALAIINRQDVMFALLDINLGQGETSEKIAEDLLDRKVPFLFVTGYGEDYGEDGRIGDVTYLTKPVSNADLFSALAKLPLKRPTV